MSALLVTLRDKTGFEGGKFYLLLSFSVNGRILELMPLKLRKAIKKASDICSWARPNISNIFQQNKNKCVGDSRL